MYIYVLYDTMWRNTIEEEKKKEGKNNVDLVYL